MATATRARRGEMENAVDWFSGYLLVVVSWGGVGRRATRVTGEQPLAGKILHEMLLKTPGLGEGLAIAKLIKIVELQESNKFRRIVLDTWATGHTLNILSAATLIEQFLSMANNAVNVASSYPALKSVSEKEQIDAKIEEVRQQIARVRDLLQDPQSTEFLIVTIPTAMAITESSRFHASLKKDGAPATRLIVNQVLPPSASECRFCAVKRKEETRALNMISVDRELGGLKLIQAPLTTGGGGQRRPCPQILQ